MWILEISDAMMVARVTMFCGWPHSRKTLISADAWVLYTGDGWGLPSFLGAEGDRVLADPNILILGPDNLMVQEKDGQLNADDFKAFLIREYGFTSEMITADSSIETQYTHGQAAVFAQHAKRNGWKRVVLFVSRHHALRAYLVTVKALMDAGLDKTVAVYLAPSDELEFDERNPDVMAGKFAHMTTWQFFADDGLPKIPQCQAKPEAERRMATWEEADKYMQWSVAQLG